MEGAWRSEDRGAGLAGLSPPARILVTLFLAAAAAGFAVGTLDVAASLGDADGRPGLSVDDLRRTFHGRPGWTLIASKVDGGSMERHVPIPSERRAILDWAGRGARLEDFGPARAVLDARCIRCHSPGGEKEDSPFAGSREAGASHPLVARYARPDAGMSPARRATTTHAHLLGMRMLFAALGFVFLHTNTRRGVKSAVIAAPFLGMFLDIGCWWLAILSPAFVWGSVAGGALAAAGVAILVVRPLWEMWGPEPKGLRV
jgi:hypothetical protein